MTIAQQLEQIGERKAALRIALAMLQNGVERPVVLKLTGLKEEDLAQIGY